VTSLVREVSCLPHCTPVCTHEGVCQHGIVQIGYARAVQWLALCSGSSCQRAWSVSVRVHNILEFAGSTPTCFVLAGVDRLFDNVL
jgi:hypothetical protein